MDRQLRPNQITSLDAAMTTPSHAESQRRGASEFHC